MNRRSNAVSADYPTAVYYTEQAVELAAQSVAAEDPTFRDSHPTLLRPPLDPAADNGRERSPQSVGSGQPTLKLPIASLPVDAASHKLAKGTHKGPGLTSRGRIGKYELRERLGKGAFGVVYTARDPSLDRDVAIKVLRPNHLRNPSIVVRFLQEARATARIAHPGIVTIHDCGQVETKAGPTAFIAMELLSGESLTARLLRCGRLTPDDASEIVRQVASALDAAHRADVLHRDLKPDNIYLVPDPAIPSGERVKVLDFGLAKLGSDGGTNVETVFGTPHYMSPEQCRSATQVDHRSDIYSLGCILFELVTGRVPFEGEVRELIEFHQFAAPPRARTLSPEVPQAVDNLIADMLAKDPMHRPQTMGAVRRALQRGDSGPQRPPSAPPMPELPMRAADMNIRAPELAMRAADMNVRVPELPMRAADMNVRVPELPMRAADMNIRAPELPMRAADMNIRAELLMRAADMNIRTPEPPARAFEASMHAFETPMHAFEAPMHAFEPPMHAPDPAVPAPMISLEAAMSGELLVPPSGPRGAAGPVSASRPVAQTEKMRWRRLGTRAKLIIFTTTLAFGSALIAWLSMR